MENIVCFATTLHIESRQGFVIGPFCPIYGVGAILLTTFLEPLKEKWYKVFTIGTILGCSFEYISSYILQALYNVKFWNYKDQAFNINGRTSVMYAICWGLLSVALIYFLNPKVNKFIKKFEYKSLDIIIAVYMSVNCLLTYNSINSYVNRIEKTSTNEQTLMTNEVMEVVFPNMLYVVDESLAIPIKEMF